MSLQPAAPSSVKTEPNGSIKSPSRLAHFVLRTSRFEELVAWYTFVLNAAPAYKDDGIAFLYYDEEHHRVAFLNVPGLAEQPDGITGLSHVAFTYDSLGDLLGNYARLKEAGILPSCRSTTDRPRRFTTRIRTATRSSVRSTTTRRSRRRGSSSSATISGSIQSVSTSTRRISTAGCSQANATPC